MKKRGTILLYTVIITSFLLIMGLTLAQTILIEQRLSAGFDNSQAAYFAAETGIEYAMNENSCLPNTRTVWLDGNVQKVGFSVREENGLFYSIGISNGVKREISTPFVRIIDLVLDSGGTVQINNLPAKYSCVNAAYSNLSEPSSQGENIIKVSDISRFAIGDGIFLYQNINSSGAGYSEVLDSTGGQFESTIKDIDYESKTITLSGSLNRNFPGNDRTQVISIKKLRSVKITNNTTLTAPGYNGKFGGILRLNSGNSLNIDSGSKIDMTAKGYRGNEGPGGGMKGTVPYIAAYTDYGGGSGAGYANRGGNAANTCLAYGGNTYGSSTGPMYMGSGGGLGDGMLNTYGYGGGLIILNAKEMFLNGVISSDGGGGGGPNNLLANGYSVDNSYAGLGGGSGGGIEIISPEIDFSGFISSAGGGGSAGKPTDTSATGFDNGLGFPGKLGIGGKGGDWYGAIGGAGGDLGSQAGVGGASPGQGSVGEPGGVSAGGGGTPLEGGSGGSPCFTGGGGGSAGRILIKVFNFNNFYHAFGHVDAPNASGKIGPYAYFLGLYY